MSATNIAAKELLPIVAIWGHRCAGTRETLYSDNSAIVHCLESQSAILLTYSTAFSFSLHSIT